MGPLRAFRWIFLAHHLSHHPHEADGVAKQSLTSTSCVRGESSELPTRWHANCKGNPHGATCTIATANWEDQTMRRTLMSGVWTVVALAGATVLGQETYNENAIDKIEGREGVVGQKGVPANVGAAAGANINAPGANVNAGVGNRPAGKPANQWRYRQHNGHWWYYRPDNQWSYWNGSVWTNYNPQAYREWYNGQFRPYANNYRYGNSGYNPYNTAYRGGYYGGGVYGNNYY